jgi:hypothetical protein
MEKAFTKVSCVDLFIPLEHFIDGLPPAVGMEWVVEQVNTASAKGGGKKKAGDAKAEAKKT